MSHEEVHKGLEGYVRTFIQGAGLARDLRPLVVGVSGGPDSLSLLYALHHLAGELDLKLHVAHLNHRLRGPESEDDAAFVSQTARKLGIPHTMGQEEVERRPARHSRSLEEKAREARYDFLAGVVEDVKGSGVAVGHTADDQVETVLLHILRGSGTPGLRGMRPVSDVKSASGRRVRVYRPLLKVTREETVSYCQALGLSPRTDSTNQSADYLRNRIRLELVPYLRAYNPKVSEAVRRLGEVASLDTEFIEAEVARLWPRVVEEGPDRLSISQSSLQALHPALRRHLLRRALEQVLGDLVDIELVHLQKLEELISRPTGKKLVLPRGIIAAMEYGRCFIAKHQDEESKPVHLTGEFDLAVPGATLVPGWRITASVAGPGQAARAQDGLAACLDLDTVGQCLTVRFRKRGDRFQPLGMEGTKKLHDFLVDAKVPRPLRDQIPLVCADGEIVWVVGWRIGERAKVTGATSKVLALEFRRT